MADPATIKAVLHETLPIPCENVEYEVLAGMIDGSITITEPPAGRPITIPDLQQILDAIVIIKTIWDLYDSVETRLKREPTNKEMEDEAKKHNVPYGNLKKEKTDEIIHSTLKHRKNKKKKK